LFMVMLFFCCLSLLALGETLAAWRGLPTVGILAWLSAAIGFLFLGVCTQPGQQKEERARRALPIVLTATVGMFAAALLFGATPLFRSDIALWILLSALVLLYLCGIRKEAPSPAQCRRVILPVVMMGFLIVSVTTIRSHPNPPIDVFLLQQAGAAALTRFHDPYLATIPDIYGPSSPFYIAMTNNGHTLYGLGYPPLIALLNLPSYWLAGDVRYGQVIALLLAAGLIAFMQSSWISLCAAVLLLINPFSQMMIQFGWIEPTLIFLLCLTLSAAFRYPRAVPYLFGLFVCAKQPNLAVFPLGLILIDGPWEWKRVVTFFGKALAVIVAINLPFYLWNREAFVISLLTVQLRVPLRTDLISYAAFFARRGWFVFPTWVAFLYLPAGILLGLWKAPRSAAGFAAAVALLFMPFFALSKQGSPNYYFLELGALCVTLAATAVNVPARQRVREPELAG
jgi:hypothetical protein